MSGFPVKTMVLDAKKAHRYTYTFTYTEYAVGIMHNDGQDHHVLQAQEPLHGARERLHKIQGNIKAGEGTHAKDLTGGEKGAQLAA